MLQAEVHRFYWTTVHSKKTALVKSNFSDGIIVCNCAFQSYRQHKIIVALSSPVTLIGNVNFTDSIASEPLVSLQTIDLKFKSSQQVQRCTLSTLHVVEER